MMSDPIAIERARMITRRHFFKNAGALGIGSMALASLLDPQRSLANVSSENPLAPVPSPQRAKAKRVIFLHMSGGPPHLDLWDYKPELVKRNDEPCPDSLLKGKKFAFTSGVPKLLGTPQKFAQHGKSGAWVSEAAPHIASIADDLTFIKSMYSDQFNHAPAELLLYTGSPRQGRPSFGSWVTYGLGSENHDLPGFIVLVSGGVLPSAGKSAWGSGFLPSVFQGVQCRTGGEPVLYANNPEGMNRSVRRMSLDALRDLNQVGSPGTELEFAL